MTVASQLESEEEEIATSTNPNFTSSVSPALATHTHASRLNMAGESFNLLLIFYHILWKLSWYLSPYLPAFELSRHRRWIIILYELTGNSHWCVHKPVAA